MTVKRKATSTRAKNAVLPVLDMKKVLVAGSFELLHAGHLNLFKQAKELAGFLVVIVARDESVKKMKGRSAFVGENERLEIVSELKIVDRARLGNLENQFLVLSEERPDVLLLGYDQVVDEKELMKTCSELKIEVKRANPFNEKEFKSSFLARKVGL